MSLPYATKSFRLGTSAAPLYHNLPVGVMAAGVAQTLQRQFFIPIRIDNKLTIKTIGCHATSTVATAVSRVGVYKDAGKYYARPGELIGEASSTISTAAAGYPEGTLSSTAGLIKKPGLYWLSIVTQTAQGTLDHATMIDPIVPLSFGTTAPAAVSPVGALYQASISGAMADVSSTATLVGSVSWPWLFFSVYGS